MKISILLTFAFLFTAYVSPSDNCRDTLALTGELEPSATRAGKDYALFFAVQDYQQMRTLQNPIANARAIAADLEEHYGFTTEVVPNPTLDDIERKLNEYKEKFAKNPGGQYLSEGQLLIYFTGHGLVENNVGYFCPADADPARIYRTAVSYEYWRNFIDGIDCKHILVAIDACYSGWFDPGWQSMSGGSLGKRPGELSESEKLIATHERFTTRWFLTSATNVESPDDSNFAYRFREGLKTWGGSDGILTTSELWTKLELSSPRPHQGRFGKNDPESSFLFLLKDPLKNIVVNDDTDLRAKDLAAWRTAKERNTIAAFQQYISDYPTGSFRAEAYDKIRQLEAEAATRREDLEWEFAKEKNTEESYQAYKNEYPAGRYVADANRRIADLKQSNAAVTQPANTPAKDSYPPGFEYLASDMVYIPGGEFDMGDNFNDPEAGSDEKPVHRVKVNSFYLSRYEVTQAQWKAVMGENPSYFTNCDICPLERVSWNDVQDYLKKLNAKTGSNFRLPTEAEWEYAAREKGRKVRFGNGKDTADPKEMNFDGSASYKENYSVAGEYRQKTVPVSSFSPNALGLYNMSGNVWEWCSDWYEENYYKQFEGKTADNPKGPTTGTSRVCRGGSWNYYPFNCRVAIRHRSSPANRLN